MDALDSRLLNLIQKDFPLTLRPFKDLGDKIGLSEKEVIKRIKNLKNRGFIRRMGGIFDPWSVGYKTTLVAAEVQAYYLEETAAFVSAFSEVTHNYQRNHRFNLWFTLIAPTQERIREIIDEVGNLPGVDSIMNLPSERLFKIRTYFSVDGKRSRI